MDKIKMASGMDDTMSFTKMSENVLEQPYARNYYNVYQKGALINMCLDILIREESNGNRGILSLMKELSLKYGINKPFSDDQIINEITEMTYPSVGDFFNQHVIGTNPINYDEYFERVGLTKVESKIETNYIMNDGSVILSPNMETGSIAFSNLVKDNSFWNDLGVKEGDVIKEINGETVSLQNAQSIFTKVYMWQPGIEIEVKLDRNGEEVIVKAETVQSYTLGRKLIVSEDATATQDKLRNAWLKG
jgi:predicted metalloprotease with PDZ domain